MNNSTLLVNDAPSSAMIFAAGLGTRMRHLTKEMPKALVDLEGRPLIDYAIGLLSDLGVSEITINLHHHADMLEHYVQSRSFGPSITFSSERNLLLETGGGVVRAAPHFSGDPVVLLNVDSIWLDHDPSATVRFINAWRAGAMDVLLGLAKLSEIIGTESSGDFSALGNGALRRVGNEKKDSLVFTGLQLVSRQLLRNYPSGVYSINRIWDDCIANQRLHGAICHGVWGHVGTPEGRDFVANRMRQIK